MGSPHSFLKNKALKELCTLKVGGPAELYVEVKTELELVEALLFCHKESLPYFILGKGSNLLFDDRGFRGLIIHNKIDFIMETSPGTFHVGAGYSFSLLGTQTARNGWSGLEFAAGIPGSVGGAIFMNAGANGMETSACLQKVHFATEMGDLLIFEKNELNFSYRSSSFHGLKGAITSAEFILSPSQQARKHQLEIMDYRIKTQPYTEQSAGCVFRNPQGTSAGALIDRCGLKGLKIGGVEVSKKHANFIVNSDLGSSADIHALIMEIKTQVKQQTGIELEQEVQVVPY